MEVLLPCQKCGLSITVGEDQISAASKAGIPLVVQHEVCPRDRSQKPEYHVHLTCYRRDYTYRLDAPDEEPTSEDTPMFETHHELPGDALEPVFTELMRGLGEKLHKIQGSLAIAEADHVAVPANKEG